MTIKNTTRALYILFCLLFVATSGVYAQDLALHFEADSDVLAVDDRVTFTLTASNTGSTNLLDVSASVLLPEFIDTFVDFPDFVCLGNCDASEEAVWSIGTLEPGESRTFFFTTFIQGAATEGIISGSATVSLPGLSDIVETVDLLIDNSREMQLSVAPASGPAVANESFTYTLSVSNMGTASIVNPVLTFPLPEGSSFVNASDGGVEDAGVVTWSLGVFGAGAGRQIQVTVRPDASLADGRLLVARAALDPNKTNEAVVTSTAVTPVRSNMPLRFAYGINQTASGATDRLVYEFTATNVGAEVLLDVTAEVLLPAFINTFVDVPAFDCLGNCDSNERALWSIGTLEPGQSQTYFFTTFIAGNAPAGHLLKSRLLGSSTGSGQVMASMDVHVDPSPGMRLSVSPASGPAVSGELFTYVLSVSNIGAASVVDPVLQFPVPEGTSYMSSSDGGVEQAGIVTWSLGVMGTGAGRQLEVTVVPDAEIGDGELLVAHAALDPNETNESIVQSVAVTPVRDNVPLRIEYGISKTAPGTSDHLVFAVVATNTGNEPLLDVVAEVLLPESINTFVDEPVFDCLGNCDANELALWSIGTLEPGQSRSYFFRTFVTGNAGDGDLLSTRLLGSSTGSGQVMASLDMHVDPSPRMRFSVAPPSSPVVAGDSISYTFSIGNIGAANPNSIQLQFPLPNGTSFVSATNAGEEQNGIVVWDLNPLKAGDGRKVVLVLKVDDDLAAGSLLTSSTSLHPNELNESVLRAVNIVPVGRRAPVMLEYAANQVDYDPGDEFVITLRATNTSQTDLLDLTVEVTLPLLINTFVDSDTFVCLGNCDANEVGVWSVGTLSPGQTRTQNISTSVSAAAALGELMSMRVEIRPTGQDQEVFFWDELVGMLANQAPGQVTITEPAGGASVSLGGETVEMAGDPAQNLTITWTAATDPEEDPLTYTWQLSLTQDFSSPLFSQTSDSINPLAISLTHGTLATVLDDAGFSLGEGVVLYHRVLVSDGENNVASPALSIELTRGLLVSNGQETGLPEMYQLHGNYPNPFNPSTTIRFDLPQSGSVQIDVFNTLGQHVHTLVDQQLEAGTHTMQTDLKAFASGIYFLRMQAGGFVQTRKMTKLAH